MSTAAVLAVAALAAVASLKTARSQEVPTQISAFVVRFLDVGQGDGAWLTTPGGSTVLIDCGPFSYGPKLVGLLKEAGVEQVDVLAPSHAHADHMGGCYHVLNSLPVGQVLWTGQTDSSTTWRTFWSLVGSVGTPVTQLVAGQVFEWGSGVRATVYNPPDHGSGMPFDEYDDSHVLLIEHGAIRFLFVGDLHPRGEARALAAGLPSAQVLKVAEHGSRSGNSYSFLLAVAPQLGVISAGLNNQFGHPHPDVLSRLAGVGASVLSTAEVGTIIITSDGATYTAVTEHEISASVPPGGRQEPPAGPSNAGPAPTTQRSSQETPTGLTSPGFDPHRYLGQGDRYNCPDFASQADAQAVLRAEPTDPNRLDADRDGIACERNPPPFDRDPVPRR